MVFGVGLDPLKTRVVLSTMLSILMRRRWDAAVHHSTTTQRPPHQRKGTPLGASVRHPPFTRLTTLNYSPKRRTLAKARSMPSSPSNGRFRNKISRWLKRDCRTRTRNAPHRTETLNNVNNTNNVHNTSAGPPKRQRWSVLHAQSGVDRRAPTSGAPESISFPSSVADKR